MPIISVSLCTRSGKPVLARQFVEISRMRIEALLSGFPKLLSPSKLQQQYMDSDNVRYVFQPMESMFLLLITTKNSNIVEDMETLRLLCKVVGDACTAGTAQQQQHNAVGLTEDLVSECAFEIVAALDEVISNGYREPQLTASLVRANLEMNSHEEKLSQMIRQTNEMNAKQEMKRQAAAIKAKKEGPGGGKMEGFGSSSSSAYQLPPSQPVQQSFASPPSPEVSKPSIGKQGMKLGKKQKNVSEVMAQEDGIEEEEPVVQLGKTTAVVPVNKDPVFVLISEQVSCTIMQDGRVASFAVNGQVSLISRVEHQAFVVQLSQAKKDFSFKPHPQVDKSRFEKQQILGLKQADRSLPVNTPFGALKYFWSGSASLETVPLSLTVWPEPGGANGMMNVNLEYEVHAGAQLSNILICIPLGSSQEIPDVQNCSIGTHRHNSRRHQLEWVIDSISSEDAETQTGSFEFNLAKSEASAFFPTVLSFQSNESLAGLKAMQVLESASQAPIRFSTEVQVATDVYEVVADE